jgi:hypothetical protein
MALFGADQYLCLNIPVLLDAVPNVGRPQEDFPYTFFGDLFRVEGQDLLFRCRVQWNGPQRR